MKKSVSVISFYNTGLGLPVLPTGMFHTEAEKKYFPAENTMRENTY